LVFHSSAVTPLLHSGLNTAGRYSWFVFFRLMSWNCCYVHAV